MRQRGFNKLVGGVVHRGHPDAASSSNCVLSSVSGGAVSRRSFQVPDLTGFRMVRLYLLRMYHLNAPLSPKTSKAISSGSEVDPTFWEDDTLNGVYAMFF